MTFYLKNAESNKYLQSDNGNMKTTEDKAEATPFELGTNPQGVTFLRNSLDKEKFLNVNQNNNKVTCHGKGGKWCHFDMKKNEDGTVSFVYKHDEKQVLGVQGDEPCPLEEAGTPATSFLLEEKTNGTIHPTPDFDPKQDAEVLRKAMKGFGTNEKEIISIIGCRTSKELTEVAKEFKTLFGRDLKEDIQSETRGNFEDALLARLEPLDFYLARCLRKAMKGAGTDEEAIIEILCTRMNVEVQRMREAYTQIFGRNLEDDLESETSGDFKRLLVSVVQGNRDEEVTNDEEEAAKTAAALYNAGEGKIGTNEEMFNKIFASISFPQLRLVFEEYKKISGKDLLEAIDSELGGSLKKGMTAIVSAAMDTPKYFADVLYKSMKGAGTDDETLIRVISSRCEIDLEDIKEAYLKNHQKSLADAIESDTGGDYKRLLIQIVGH